MKTLLRILLVLSLSITPLLASFENTQRSLLPANTNPRAPRQGLVFDGTAGATGTAVTIGTADLTFSQWVRVPSTVSETRGLFLFSPAGSIGATSLLGYVDSDATLNIHITGATSGDRTKQTLSGFVTSYAGKWVNILFTRVGSTWTGYINGVATTFSASTSGTAPTWAGSISGAVVNFGSLGSSGAIYNDAISAINLYNRALSASEVVALYEAGAPSANDIPGTAAGTAIAASAGVNTGNILTSYTSSAGQWQGTVAVSTSPYVRYSTGRINVGNKFRVSGTVAFSGGTLDYFGITQQGSGTGSASLPTSNGNFDVTITAHSYQASGLIDFFFAGNGVTVTVTNLVITPLGLLLAPDAAQAGGGLVWYDTSGNAANITLPASGVRWNVPSSGTIPFATSGSSNTATISADSSGALIVTPKAGQYTTLSVSGNSGLLVNNGTTQVYLGNSGGNAVAGTLNANDFLLIRDGAVKLTATATGVDIYGNLTVSGTGTSSFGGPVQVSNTLAAKETNASLTLQPGPGTGGINYAFGQGTGDHVWYGGTTERMRLTYLGNFLIGTTNDAPNARLHVLGANNAGLRIDQGSYNYYSAYEHIFQAVSFGTIYGKFANNGSLILKSDGVDSGNGRLQLATHSSYTGGIGFGPDNQLWRYNNVQLVLSNSSGTSGSAVASNMQLRVENSGNGGIQINVPDASTGGVYFGRAADAYYSGVERSGTNLQLRNNGTTALTLDSSQNATFAGTTKITNGNLQVYGYNGNSALAAIFLNADQSSYIYNDNAHVNFRAGGVDGLKLASGTGNATFAGNINAGGASNDADVRLHLNAAGDTSAKYCALWRNGSSNKVFHVKADGDLYTSGPATIGGALTVSGGGTNVINGPSAAITTSGSGVNGTLRLTESPSSGAMLMMGTHGGNYAYVQMTNSSNLAAAYPIALNPNGGNVGIGTTTPGAQLEIGGTNPEIRLGPVSSSSGAYMSYNTAGNYFSLNAVTQGVGYRKLVFANDGGNVLIGTTIDGGQKLQVSGTIAASLGVSSNGALAAYPAANSAAMDWYGGYARFWGVGADASTAGGIKLIVSSTDGSPAVDALTIVSSGDATFAGRVTVNGTDGLLVNKSASLSVITMGEAVAGSYSRFNMRTGSDKYAWSIAAQDIVDNALTITPSTAVGGTTFTTPVFTLAQSGNATFAGTVTTSTTNTSQSAGNGNKLISSGGVWVVNAATNDAFSYYNSSASAYRFYVDGGGTISATNTAISAISDARLKENVRDLSGGLSSILALKPRVFDWKEGKGANKKNVRGFIAQEIEQVFPDLVDEWKDAAPEGEAPYKSVRQDLIPVLVKAIQELKAEIDSLKAARN